MYFILILKVKYLENGLKLLWLFIIIFSIYVYTYILIINYIPLFSEKERRKKKKKLLIITKIVHYLEFRDIILTNYINIANLFHSDFSF